MFDIEKVLRETRIVVSTVLVGIICVKIAALPDLNVTTNNLNKTVDNANSLITSAHKFGHKVALDYDDPTHPTDGLYYNIQNDLYNSQTASKNLSDTIMQTNENLNGKAGLFHNITTLLASANTDVLDLGIAINNLSTTSQETLKPLKDEFNQITTLTVSLNDEIKAGGNIDLTVVKLNKAIDDADTLMANPDIAKTIANGQSITKHLDSSAESLDDVLLPYRKKLSQIKWVLDKLIGMIKLTLPVF